ncbi:MAG: M23 family metallopeptidase [Dehalococcoidia bacterium]
MDLEGLGSIVPMGRMQSSHVTPVDHTYFLPRSISEMEDQAAAFAAGAPALPWDPGYDAYSPADGQITEIGTFPFRPAPAGYTGVVGNYRLVIWHSCTTYSIFIHTSTLSQEILDVTGEIKSGDTWFPGRDGETVMVKAGQALGKVGTHGFDFGVHDTDVLLPGFVIPERYDGEPWKVHTVDPFAYFTEPLRSSLQGKSLRSASPQGGKIDYDIDGRLVGNWFLDGTVDYSGQIDLSLCTDELCNYWSGHLAIAYDHIDPDQVRISIGRDLGIDPEKCRVCQGVYAVSAGSPDPADVSVETGLVKYQLVARDFVNRSENPERTRPLEDQPLGVLLVQLEDDRTIRMEVIPDKTTGQVQGFSGAALVYRR